MTGRRRPANALRRARELYGMTQARLGARCNVSPRCIWELEHGGICDMALALAISRVLDCGQNIWDLDSATVRGVRAGK